LTGGTEDGADACDEERQRTRHQTHGHIALGLPQVNQSVRLGWLMTEWCAYYRSLEMRS
jgi:hypothetical protein